MAASSARRGLTRTDLCVIIVGLIALACWALPKIGTIRDLDMHRSQCISNQQQIGLAMTLYATSKGTMPYSVSTFSGAEGRQICSWVQPLLSQLGRADLAQSADPFTAQNAPYISLIVCPSDRRKVGAQGGPLSYVVNSGSFKHWKPDGTYDCLDHGVWNERFDKPSQSTSMILEFIARHGKGTTNTISHSENLDARSYHLSSLQADYEDSILWDPSAPLGFNQDAGNGKLDNAHARPSSNHPGGAVVGFCDGHVAFISDAIDYKVYATLMAVETMKPAQAGKPLKPTDPLSDFFVWPLDPSMIPTIEPAR